MLSGENTLKVVQPTPVISFMRTMRLFSLSVTKICYRSYVFADLSGLNPSKINARGIVQPTVGATVTF